MRVVVEERLERPEAGDLGGDLLDEADALVLHDDEAVAHEDPVDERLDGLVELRRIGDVQQ